MTATTTPPRTDAPEASASGARYERPGPDGIGRLVLDRPDDHVNALNEDLIDALDRAVREARADPALKGLLVVSAKPKQWMAGADLKLLSGEGSADDLERVVRRFQAVCDMLDWLPATSVAVISGPALGGGLELALACDYRVAADDPAVTVGQSEVSLGLVPAGGGTQRLPRLVGLPRALDLILTGRRLNARRARRAGVLDEVVHPAVLEQAARSWARKPKRPRARPRKGGLNAQAALDLLEQSAIGRRFLYRQARESVLERTHGHYPAPLAALDAVRTGFERGVAAGLEVEVRAFRELAAGSKARNLIRLFLATQHQKRESGVDEPVTPAPVERIGVVGAGFMGAGIAEVAAAAGLPVRLRDVEPAAVARGLGSVRKIVVEGAQRGRFDRREAREIQQRVSGTTDYSGFASADLAIEAVFESLPVKRQVVRELEDVLPPSAVIASNTSALPIREIAADARHPERIVGMHFFSPAHRMPLLEVIRSDRSSSEAVATAVAVGNRLGKTVIVVRDGPGFYTTRVLGVMMNEAALLLSEGVSMREVDEAMVAFGFPVGPFVLYDEIGLEVAQHVGATLAMAFGGRQPEADVVPRLVAAGRTGKRAGRGFYLWPPPQRRSRIPLPWATDRSNRVDDGVVAALLGNPSRRHLGPLPIQERLVLLFVNEAIRCLDEGVLRSANDGDLGAVLGIGFPPFLGGPFRYADAMGTPRLRDRLAQLAAEHGERYEPPDLLVEKARTGATFYED